MSQELLENLKALAEKIAKNKKLVKEEAHTRAEFVKPFLKILGYDGIEILVPEYPAGFGSNDKVDYAILSKDKPLAIVEIKHHGVDLDSKKPNNNPQGQLAGYFSACARKGCKFGILTNGLEYRFFADTQKQNTMDSTPFMVLNLESTPLDSLLTSEKLAILELFSQAKLSSNLAMIRKRAISMLKQNAENALCADIKEFLAKELNKPSDEFVGFVIDKKFSGTKKTAPKIKEFRGYITRACSELISDKVSESMCENTESQGDSKELSEDEIGAFYIVRGILMENPKATLQNIVPRGTAKAKYFSVLLEDNKNKWICRIYLKHINDKYLAIPDKHDSTKETRFAINNLSDIYKYKNELLESLKMRLKRI
ncbi:type I restriction endonuclease [Helicobacter sp. 23-1048]